MTLDELEQEIIELGRGIEAAKQSRIETKEMIDAYCAKVDAVVVDIKQLQA